MIDREKVKLKISKTEDKTVAEIVPAIIPYSDNYSASYYRCSLFFACLLVILSFFVYPDKHFAGHVKYFCAGYLIGLSLTYVKAVKRFFVTKDEIIEETMQKAYQIFLEHKIHQTSNRSGVLLFLSLFEKRAIVLADKAINDKLDPETWNELIDGLTNSIRTDGLENAFLNSLDQISEILIDNFPGSEKENELDDSLV